MTIFRDREKLTPRYIPSSPPHRDEEIQLMREKFSEVVPRRGAVFPKPVQVIGAVGTGCGPFGSWALSSFTTEGSAPSLSSA